MAKITRWKSYLSLLVCLCLFVYVTGSNVNRLNFTNLRLGNIFTLFVPKTLKTLADLRKNLDTRGVLSSNDGFYISSNSGQHVELVDEAHEEIDWTIDMYYIGQKNIATGKTNTNNVLNIHNIANTYAQNIQVPSGITNLAELREFLIAKRLISRDCAFFTKLCDPQGNCQYSQIMSEEKATLATNGPNLYFGILANDQIAINFFYGVTIGSSQQVLPLLKVAKFQSYYKANEIQPQETYLIESKSTKSQRASRRFVEGIVEGSVSVNTPWADASVSGTHSSTNEHSSENQRTFIGVRAAVQKLEVILDQQHLIPSEYFIDELESAMTGGQSLESCKRVVRVLNKYGWYIPVKYVLGGVLTYSTTTTSRSSESSSSIMNKLEASVSARFGPFGGAASVGASKNTQNSGSSQSVYEGSTKRAIGGDGSTEVEPFISSLNDQNTWRVIKYKEFLPTLKLIEQNAFQAEIVKVLAAYGYHNSIKTLQPIIDVKDYANKLKTATHFEYSSK